MKKGFNRLGRNSSHRRALLRNMVTSFLRYGRIESTHAKLLEVRRFSEKLITRARIDNVHQRRQVARFVYDKGVAHRLFTEIAPRFVSRSGGYTRILKLGARRGDGAEMAVLAFVDFETAH